MKTLIYAVVALLCLFSTAPVKAGQVSYPIKTYMKIADGGIVTIVQGFRTAFIHGDIRGLYDVEVTRKADGKMVYLEEGVTFPGVNKISIEGWDTGKYFVEAKRGNEVYTSHFEVPVRPLD